MNETSRTNVPGVISCVLRWFAANLWFVLVVAGCSNSRLESGPAPISKTVGSQAGVPAGFVAGLDEPLIATHATTLEEDAELRAAVAAFRAFAPGKATDARDAMEPLERFAARHPGSGWAVAVRTDLGLAYYRSGYFSRALASFDSAWKAGRSVTGGPARAVVDRALGELLRMHARLGHVEALESLLQEIGDRPVTGPATELIQGARDGLWTMRHDPGLGFLCGPRALKNLLIARGAPTRALDVVEAARSSERGFTLEQLDALAARAGLERRLVHREPGQPVPVPSIVNWKTHHYAAITLRDDDGRFHVQDPTFGFGTDLALTEAAIDEESSGFFLIPETQERLAWRPVTETEARTTYGMGAPAQTVDNLTRPTDAKAGQSDPKPGDFPPAGSTPDDIGAPSSCDTPMCRPSVHLASVSLNLNDTPVGYAPKRGPAVFSRITFNQRDAGQPAAPGFFNVSPKWTLNWLSYMQDDPAVPGASVTRYAAGGGYQIYAGFNTNTGNFTGEVETGMVLTRNPATGPLVDYRLEALDGSALVFAQSDGASSGIRRVFLSKVVDARGNALNLDYDGALRLVSITDADGNDTTFCYDPTRQDCASYSGSSLLVSRISDPFGRSADIDYDDSGRLAAITDVYGIKSSVTYDPNGGIDSLTTPYGTSRFVRAFPECTGTARCLELTDPTGNTERVEYRDAAPGIPFSDPAVPTGIYFQNSYLNYRSTYVWDAHAYSKYGSGAGKDYTKAVHYHFMHAPNTNYTGWAIESIKRPLESRVWYNRGGNYSSVESSLASGDAVSAAARILDDGSTQLSTATYNLRGKLASLTDPSGRVTKFTYAANNIDLVSVQQQTVGGASPSYATLALFTYDDRHQPLSYTDAAGNTTKYGYNAAGQLEGVIDPQQNQTTYEYSSSRLVSVADGQGTILVTLAYDDFDRVATRTNALTGYQIHYEYDALDRITQISYPDGTVEAYVYDKLDLAQVTDRGGHETTFAYDAARRLVRTTDALGQETRYEYFPNGLPKSLTDSRSHTTSWEIDIQGRVTAKKYPGGASKSFSYESATGRVKQITFARGQTTAYTYNRDDTISTIDYPGASPPVASVGFQYDPVFPRPIGMTDALGQTDYAYYPIGPAPSLGAGLLKSIESPVAGSKVASDTVKFVYDELNRMKARSVNGAVEQLEFDSRRRLSVSNNALDRFSYAYGDASARLTGVTSKHGPRKAFSYLPAEGDELLGSISVSTLQHAPLSTFEYQYDAHHNVTTFTQTYVGQKLAARTRGAPGAPPGPSGFRSGPKPGSHEGRFPWVLLVSLLIAFGAVLAVAPRSRRGGRRLAPAFAMTVGVLLAASCGDDAHQGKSGESGMAGEAPLGGGVGDGGAGSPAGPAENAGTAGAAVVVEGGSPGQGGGAGAAAGPSLVVTAYTYDATDRLLSAAIGTELGLPAQPQFSYEYDPVSNLTRIDADGAELSLSYTATNAIAESPHDLDGNPESLAGRDYTWDAAGRLTKVVAGDSQSEFSYDGLSRLVRIRDFEGEDLVADRAFLWCGPVRCAERDNLEQGSPVVKEFFAQGMKVGAERFFYVTDALGSVRQLVDAGGVVRAQYDYDPYGNVTKLSGDVDSDIGYAGYFQHAPTRLAFALYRAYDPALGRWLNRDPLGEAGGINLYAYVGGRPTVSTDPTGLDTFRINRELGGDEARRTWNALSHTFVVTTNPDGTVAHTYSWGNDANTHGWHVDQQFDIDAATEALRRGFVERIGGSDLDPYVQQAFDRLNLPQNEHRWWPWNNCKHEAQHLIDEAQRLHSFDPVQQQQQQLRDAASRLMLVP